MSLAPVCSRVSLNSQGSGKSDIIIPLTSQLLKDRCESGPFGCKTQKPTQTSLAKKRIYWLLYLKNLGVEGHQALLGPGAQTMCSGPGFLPLGLSYTVLASFSGPLTRSSSSNRCRFKYSQEEQVSPLRTSCTWLGVHSDWFSSGHVPARNQLHGQENLIGSAWVSDFLLGQAVESSLDHGD